MIGEEEHFLFHIVCCIKQVPDSREIRIDPKTNTLIRQGVPSIVNFYDLHGVEEALRIKDKDPENVRVTVVSMGPPMAEKSLKQCISLGADEAILVTDRGFAGADTLATSYVIATAIEKIAQTWGPVDLIFCGKQTLDGDTGQVGPGVACRLDVDQLTYIEKIEELDKVGKRIRVHRHLEEGLEVVETAMPCLVTVVKEINTPRRASMPGLLRAYRYKPITWTTADFPGLDRTKIGLKGSPTIVGKSWVPEPKHTSECTQIKADDPVAAAQGLFDAIYATDLPKRVGWTQGGVA